jgi:hypothetical protein
MAAVIIGSAFFFGVGNNIKLPDGWEIHEAEGKFVTATAPSGKIYYVGTGKAYPRLQFCFPPPLGCTVGEYYAETKHGVIYFD